MVKTISYTTTMRMELYMSAETLSMNYQVSNMVTIRKQLSYNQEGNFGICA